MLLITAGCAPTMVLNWVICGTLSIIIKSFLLTITNNATPI